MARISICDGWEFTLCWNEIFASFQGEATAVRLPHNPRTVPLHYASPEHYESVCGYRKRLTVPADLRQKRLFLQFDGAAHIATLYINGKERMTHRCGYTAFRLEVTDDLTPEGTVEIAVCLDTTENPAIPPFGFVIDYLTYGGLYREVWLDAREHSFLSDVSVTTPEKDLVAVSCQMEGKKSGQSLRVRILDHGGAIIQERIESADVSRIAVQVPEARLWAPEHPYLYTCEVALLGADGTVHDTETVPFGFRTARFAADGFYLNGEKYFLRGLNRHQSYPYVGYAVPERLQREDARILKEELGCNAVRTSHYPQSHHFLRACDELGLLVFTEIPGWQHIGDDSWKEQACENVREMITQYKNHTSIFLWGVRINESQDDDDFYRRTNQIAHTLDPSRSTSGVRYLEKSSLLEDVYAYNDFSHTGQNPGAKPKKQVTPDMNKALLISECNGHMYPTKAYDSWAHRQEQALRHARVLDAAMSDGGHVGCFGWCMFDYPTHKDFGSGDRICYHGVLDAFRNPKTAAMLYASQSEEMPVLFIGSAMDIGDYPGGQIDPVYIFTNAEKVALYKNGQFVSTLSPKGWKGLKHGPVPLDDTIGCLLETQEQFPKKKEKLIKRCLLSAKKFGLAGLPTADKLRLLWAMVRYKMSFADGVALYGKYVGNWGGESTRWRFDAINGDQVVASVTCAPSHKLHLEVTPSHTLLSEGDTYDMAAVRIRILDENGIPAPYAQYPLKLTLTGDAELIGPDVITAEGGMCGAYLRTVGKAGRAKLTVSADTLEPVEILFSIT